MPEPPTRPDGPSLSFYSIRERDRWYEDERDRGTGLDQAPRVRDLLQRLAEPGLSPYTIRDVASWYEEEANRRRVGTIIDQDALDRDLRRLLAERGVFPECIEVEFERVMQVVFPDSAPKPKPAPAPDAERPAWSSLSPRAVEQLSREFSGLKTSSAAELEDAIRTRLAKSGVPPEAIDVEVEKVVRRIEALGDADGVNFPTHAGRATEPASYEVLGPAPPGERCVRCGKSSGVKRIKHGSEVDLLHEGCARDLSAAMANPTVKLPDLGPDPLDEHGAPRTASVPFMLTQEMKRGLRAYGYSDEEVAHLTPQQAHEILVQERRQPNA